MKKRIMYTLWTGNINSYEKVHMVVDINKQKEFEQKLQKDSTVFNWEKTNNIYNTEV